MVAPLMRGLDTVQRKTAVGKLVGWRCLDFFDVMMRCWGKGVWDCFVYSSEIRFYLDGY